MNYYDEIASGYEELYGDEQHRKLAIIQAYFKPKKTDLILDVGCGSGLTTRIWNCKAIGIDPAFKLLPKEPYYINGEAEYLPFKDNVFDVVISVTALQNFHDIKKALHEIRRVGKRRFILSYLKKSKKSEEIRSLIQKLFNIKKIVIEDKDIIFFI